MGCDGGTIPKRDELVRTKKKKETTSKESQCAAKWNYCHLSQLPLQKPIVIDLLGNLYNKETVIEYLLDKSKFEKGADHLKTLKDVRELSLVANPNYEASKLETSQETSTLNKAHWICPITGLEMSGTYKFYCLFSCGCAFSERAYRSIANGAASTKCLKCDKPYVDYDLLVMNPSEDDVKQNEAKMKARKDALAKAKSEKKSNGTTGSTSSSVSASSDSLKEPDQARTSGLSKQPVAFEGPKVGPKRPIASTEAVSTNSASKKSKSSIQSDPTTSDVYKSLFNTCDKAKNQTKAHWVTFNPQYF